MRPSVIDIGSRRQLFLDDHLIERMQGVGRQLHRPRRYGDRPLLEADQPWEQGGNGVSLMGGTVLYDEEEHIYKMWCRNSRVVETVTGYETPHSRGYTSCYALSADGLRWEKPAIGQVEYEGSSGNNILPPALRGSAFIRRPNLIKDRVDPDPSRRYKMAYMDEVGDRWALCQGYSADGIRWNMNAGSPTYFERSIVSNGMLFGWDHHVQRYVFFHRTFGRVSADVDGRTIRRDGALVRSTSANFEAWGDTREIVSRSESDPPDWEPGHLGVLAAIAYTDDLYVGILDVSTSHHIEDVPEQLWTNVYEDEHAEHHTELVVSRDGVPWDRVAPHWKFLRPGLWGTWDDTLVALTKPMVLNDEILFYYTGRNLPCGAQLPGHPQRGLLNEIVDGRRMGYAIGLARMRLDGFASLDGDESGGTVTTRPLCFTGDRLYVNARAPERPFGDATSSGPWGSFQVEILDLDEEPLTGYGLAECEPRSGDHVRHEIMWKGYPDLGRLSGQPVRLRFHLRNAALYSFQFAAERPSAVCLPAPGSRDL